MLSAGKHIFSIRKILISLNWRLLNWSHDCNFLITTGLYSIRTLSKTIKTQMKTLQNCFMNLDWLTDCLIDWLIWLYWKEILIFYNLLHSNYNQVLPGLCIEDNKLKRNKCISGDRQGPKTIQVVEVKPRISRRGKWSWQSS